MLIGVDDVLVDRSLRVFIGCGFEVTEECVELDRDGACDGHDLILLDEVECFDVE